LTARKRGLRPGRGIRANYARQFEPGVVVSAGKWMLDERL
jgi:hypothetical protein